MSILITGGNGYVGSQIVYELLNNESYSEKIIILDQIQPNEKILKNTNFQNKVIFKKASILEESVLKDIFQDVNQVIHLAAIADVKKCEQNPDETRTINIDGLKNILEIARKSDVKRIIFASTMSAIYGNSMKFDELESPNPVTKYGKQKLEGENLLKDYSSKYSLESLILRKSNLYGNGVLNKENVVAAFVKNSLKNKQMKIEGSGKQFRNFLHVYDATQAYFKALKAKLPNRNEIINIAGSETMSLIELANVVKNEIEKNTIEKINILHTESERKDDFGKIEKPEIVTLKAKKILGYSPKITLKHGIKNLIEYYKKNNYL